MLFCPWESPHYLFFSSNVPYLLHYSHIPNIVVSLFLGFFIYFKNRNPSSGLLLLVIYLFTFFIILDSLIWASNRSDLVMFLWSLQVLIEPFIFIFSFYLIYILILEKDIDFNQKIILFLPVLPFLALISTKYNLSGIRIDSCDADEGLVAAYYSYFLEMLFVFSIIFVIIRKYIYEKNRNIKNKIIILGMGVTFFLLAFSWGNIVGTFTENWELAQYGLFGMPFFLGVLAYLIVKYQLFNIKLLAVQALVAVLIFLIGSQFFFIKSPVNMVLNGITLLLSVIAGLYLIRSVKKEIKRREEVEDYADRLGKANDRLKVLDRAKSEFLSIASHQLRTPLSAIKGFSSLILEDTYGPIPDVIRGVVEKIHSCNERLVQLVEDLLNISRIEGGRFIFRFTPGDIVAITREVLTTLQFNAKNKKIYLTMKAPEGGVAPFVFDQDKVKEVISNVVDNAIKYTFSGGVTIYVYDFPDVVQIIVADTGVGMTPEDIKSVFKKFQRGSGVDKFSAEGMGLGLYICKKIMDAHQAKFWSESKGKSAGSRFVLEFKKDFVEPKEEVRLEEKDAIVKIQMGNGFDFLEYPPSEAIKVEAPKDPSEMSWFERLKEKLK